MTGVQTCALPIFVFVANHHSHADTPLLLTSIPDPWRHRTLVGAAADYFFGNRFSGAVSALAIGAVPIERTRVGRRSADMARDLIDDGWSMLLYPEGGRSPDGWGQEFRGGAAFLAIRCNVPVVPIHLQGTGRILRKGRTLPRPSRTTVTFGNPLVPTEGENARAFAVRLQSAVAALGDEATSDWWQARRRAHAGTSPGLTGPDVGAWRRAWALGARARRSRRPPRRWPALCASVPPPSRPPSPPLRLPPRSAPAPPPVPSRPPLHPRPAAGTRLPADNGTTRPLSPAGPPHRLSPG